MNKKTLPSPPLPSPPQPPSVSSRGVLPSPPLPSPPLPPIVPFVPPSPPVSNVGGMGVFFKVPRGVEVDDAPVGGDRVLFSPQVNEVPVEKLGLAPIPPKPSPPSPIDLVSLDRGSPEPKGFATLPRPSQDGDSGVAGHFTFPVGGGRVEVAPKQEDSYVVEEYVSLSEQIKRSLVSFDGDKTMMILGNRLDSESTSSHILNMLRGSGFPPTPTPYFPSDMTYKPSHHEALLSLLGVTNLLIVCICSPKNRDLGKFRVTSRFSSTPFPPDHISKHGMACYHKAFELNVPRIWVDLDKDPIAARNYVEDSISLCLSLEEMVSDIPFTQQHPLAPQTLSRLYHNPDLGSFTILVVGPSIEHMGGEEALNPVVGGILGACLPF